MTWPIEIRDVICERIALGESLVAICKTKGMPTRDSVMRWLREDTDFQAQYAQAKEDCADLIFDEVLQIADNSTPENVPVDRLRIDARKWMAGKLRPRKYSDKIDLSHEVGEQLRRLIIND